MADDEKPKPVSPGGETPDDAAAGGASPRKTWTHPDAAADRGELDVRALHVPGMSAGGTPADDGAESPPRIGGYEILSRLGEGGQGTVWRAVQLSTKRQVALKLLSRGRLGSSKVRARFEREVELAARLRHPNIAEVFDSGVCGGVYYYAMALIDGVALDEYVEANGLDQREILGLMQTVCQAVHHAHQRQVIHRDLKPSNILVSQDGQPYVVDFGLAKALLEEGSGITLSLEGGFMGTPPYSSPEQAAGRHREIDTRTDIYALGVILYQLLTRQSPHDLSGPLPEVLGRIMHEDVRRPREISRAVDRDLEAVLLKALERNQDDRYASAAEMAQDLQSYLHGEELAARAPMTLDHLRRAVARYPVALGIGLTLVALLIDVVVIGTVRIDEESHKAEVADRRYRQAVDAQRQAAARADQMREEVYASRLALAGQAYKQGDLRRANEQLLSCPADLREGQWHRLRRLVPE